MPADDLFSQFETTLRASGRAAIGHGLIGKDARIVGPWGERAMIYADYVASGRALMQVEQAILEHVLPYYANSHTRASHCGSTMTHLRDRARAYIARCCGASNDEHAVIFGGSGATAGINRLVHLLGVRKAVAQGRPVRVVIGPYEHHSNILPWRESGAEVIEIAEAARGGPDLDALDRALAGAPDEALLLGAFSAASNVTGILTDVGAVTAALKRHGALAVWDYAGGGPYLPIAMQPQGGVAIDAVVISPHKFIGGPGASGVTIVRRKACVGGSPSQAGGGTVQFVSPWGHDYSDRLEAREEAGTPNVIGDIRAALAFAVKSAIGQAVQSERGDALVARALAAWSGEETIEVLGSPDARRLPIFSFRIRDGRGGYVHHQLITRLLSDRHGIQARGGCACAGPYVHRLLGLDWQASEALRNSILGGRELEKPGFIRLNLSVLMHDTDVDFVLDSVRQLSRDAPRIAHFYRPDHASAVFVPNAPDLTGVREPGVTA